MTNETPTPEVLHGRFREMAEATARHTFFEDALFENLTIKEAKERAATMASYSMRFAMDYHQSMAISEKNASNTKGDQHG